MVALPARREGLLPFLSADDRILHVDRRDFALRSLPPSRIEGGKNRGQPGQRNKF
jgi:hypothetical protein